ncbi:hypothetical protein ACFL2H_01230 [Planctomycetota bacterium]
MKLVEVNWQPTNRQLRQFGVICLFALPAIAWFWGGGRDLIAAFAAVGGVLAVGGMTLPFLLKPIFIALMVVTTPIGIVVGELAMMLIYFGCFLPMGILFRILRRDSLHRNLEPGKTTYWSAKKKPTSVASYYRQS